MSTLSSFRPRLLLAAALLPGALAPAAAATTVDLVDRLAQLQVWASAGFGVAAAHLPCTADMESCTVVGDLGTDTVLTGLSAPTLAIAGESYGMDVDGIFSAEMATTWQSSQGFAWAGSGSDVVLTAFGRHDSTLWSRAGSDAHGYSEGSRSFNSINRQTFVFTLDDGVDFTLAGSNYGEYMPLELLMDDGTGAFEHVNLPGITALSPYTMQGHWSAGTYMLRNYPLPQADFQDSTSWGWDYSLTFHDAVTAVPEPGSMAMLALGLAVVGTWRRRRVTSD